MCELKLIPFKRFKTNEQVKGMRIDQILCLGLDMNDFEEILCDGINAINEIEKQEWANGLFDT